MTKAEKEAKIIEQIHYLSELDNVGCYGYYYMRFLWDAIATIVFAVKHDHAGHMLYPNGKEGEEIDRKIGIIVRNMENKGIIKVSKSRKMFKTL